MIRSILLVALVLGMWMPASAHWFFKIHDADGDGYVTLQEFRGTVERFRVLDANRDGRISISEAPSGGAPGSVDVTVQRPGVVVRPVPGKVPIKRIYKPGYHRRLHKGKYWKHGYRPAVKKKVVKPGARPKPIPR